MECPNCHFLVTPGQESVQGVCPNCERPYRDQPTPLNSDMAVRDMPDPGEEDTGGNPLQEGILGDYQNSKVRDEAFASVRDPEFEVTDVVVPDPDSLRTDKEQMAQKKADFLDTLGDIGKEALPVAGGIAGGAVGALTLNPAGVAAGAAIGSGLGGAAEGALNGESAGDVVQNSLGDAALGGISGGLGGAALKAGGMLGEEAAGQGMTQGGIGSWMKSAFDKVPTDKLKSAYMTHSLLQDAQNATTPQAPAGGAPMGAPAPVVGPSYYSKTAAPTSTPTSQDHIPSNDTDDPEEVDFHERNDGDNESKGLENSQDVNDIGGTDQGPEFFSPDSAGLSMFGELLPKILQFAIGDQSAAGDPDIEKLHQALEAETPGYLDKANDDDGTKLMMVVLKGAPGDEESGDDLLPDNDTPHDPVSEHQATALKPGLESTCPMCGSVMDASVGHCPQCGAPNGMAQPQPTNPDFTTPQQMVDPPPAQNPTMPVTAAGQGPNTPEQQALVAELLIQEGRQDEIPAMITEPHEYAAELAKITGGEEPPADIGQEGPPPAVTPPQEESQMPVPPMSGQPMMAAINKYAGTVDGICEPCPNCGSHSTGYTDYKEGDAGCKTCHHKWKADPLVEHSGASGYLITPGQPQNVPQSQHPTTPVDPRADPNCPYCAEGHCSKHMPSTDLYPGGAQTYLEDANNQLAEKYGPAPSGSFFSAVDSVEPESPTDQFEEEQSGSLGWTDSNGAPLAVGQTYNMYSGNYDIPDPIKIDAVKPEVIEFTILGEYGLSHKTEITHDEASMQQLEFQPSSQEGEPAPEEAGQGAELPSAMPGYEESDSSTPHMMMSNQHIAFDDINGPYGPNMSGPEGPSIREMHDALRAMGINPLELSDEDVIKIYNARLQEMGDPVTPQTDALNQAFQAPSVEHPMGGEDHLSAHEQITTSMQPHYAGDEEDDHMAPELQWLKGDSAPQQTVTAAQAAQGSIPKALVEPEETGPEWLNPRTAGAHMTPWEQRGYIDEIGDARNADKLNLAGTHYEVNDLDDAFLFGL